MTRTNRTPTRSRHDSTLAISLAVAALAISVFLVLTINVVGHGQIALLNPTVESWSIAHRTPLLSRVMELVTWLGSITVILPLLLIAVVAFVARRDRRSAILLILAVAGAAVLFDRFKAFVGEPRPPFADWIGTFNGLGFPSGHATQAVAFYGMLALLLSTGRSRPARALLWSLAACIALLVGASRIYLGAHWLIDVIGGYALGVSWIAVLMAADRLRRARMESLSSEASAASGNN